MFTEKKKFSESILPDLTFLSRHLWCAGGGWRLDQHDHPQCWDQPGQPGHLQAAVQPPQPGGEDQLRGDHPDQEQGGVVPVLGYLPLHHLVRLAWWKISAQNFPHSGPEGSRNSRPGEFLQVLQVDRRIPGEKSVRWETLLTATFLAMFTIIALQLYGG